LADHLPLIDSGLTVFKQCHNERAGDGQRLPSSGVCPVGEFGNRQHHRIAKTEVLS
jgi:hypothetical protein